MARLKMERGQDNEILRTVSKTIKKIDRKLAKFAAEMEETMYKEEGIGLAAPQVGVNERIVVCRFNHESSHEVVVPMVNPEITSKSKEMVLSDEGCLSLPKQFDTIARHDAVVVKFKDLKGKECVLKLDGLNARIVQHEVDHINGKLYIDHLKDAETLALKREERLRAT